LDSEDCNKLPLRLDKLDNEDCNNPSLKLDFLIESLDSEDCKESGLKVGNNLSPQLSKKSICIYPILY